MPNSVPATGHSERQPARRRPWAALLSKCRFLAQSRRKGGDARRVSGLTGAAILRKDMIRAHWPPARDPGPALFCMPRPSDSPALAGHLHPPKFSVHGSAFPHINRDQPSRLLSSLNLRFTPSRHLHAAKPQTSCFTALATTFLSPLSTSLRLLFSSSFFPPWTLNRGFRLTAWKSLGRRPPAARVSSPTPS